MRYYKVNKKARFQNSSYYFSYGIAVPMVSSSCITAALIENRLFDQSIVGIFPKDTDLTPYLLAYFNSPTCNQLIRTINPTANNPANYLKKIPFKRPDDSLLSYINTKVNLIITSLKAGDKLNTEYQSQLNAAIAEQYGF